MMIGHGSRPKPLRRDTITSRPRIVTVGMARPTLMIQAAASSPLRWWASTIASGTAITSTTARATAECQTVSHSLLRDRAAARLGPRGR